MTNLLTIKTASHKITAIPANESVNPLVGKNYGVTFAFVATPGVTLAGDLNDSRIGIALQRILKRFHDDTEALETFERYVRIFHPTFVTITDFHTATQRVVAWSELFRFNTDFIREVFDLFHCWVSGYVYMLKLERAHDWFDADGNTMRTWDVESLHGPYYGSGAVVSGAAEILDEDVEDPTYPTVSGRFSLEFEAEVN